MRRLMIWLAVLCLMLTATASAEIELAPQVKEWDEAAPLEVTLQAEVATHMPFDDNRRDQLNGLLKHMALRLNTTVADDEDIGRVALQVDGRDVAWMMQKENAAETQLRLSWQPGVTYSATGSALESLAGDMPEISLRGVSADKQQWLEDGPVLLAGVGEALEEYKKQESIKTTIKGMGVARTKIYYTVPKSEAELFGDAVAACAPAGSTLGDFLAGLTFSGQQKLIVWLDADGRMLRAEYAGKCGVGEDSLRQVSLVWRMCRTEEAIKDDITLKTPAVKGEDYNTLTMTRNLLKDENGVVTVDGKYNYAVRKDKHKDTRSGEGKLTSTPEEDGTRLSGSVTLKRKQTGDDYALSTVLKPDVLLGSLDGTPVVSGTVQVQDMYGDNVVEDATIHVDVAEGNALLWEDAFAAVDMNAMDEQQLTEMLEGLSAAVVPHLVLLPQEDTLFISADLPEDVWQKITEAARNALPEEETP